MADRKTKYSKETISLLRSVVENRVNRRIVSPADFDYLSRTILNTIKQSVSATTLKRVWEYNNDVGSDYNPERFTLCILAAFVGYRDIEDFITKYNPDDNPVQSANYYGETIEQTNIPGNKLVEISWPPNRQCVLCRKNGKEFEVVYALNSKLQIGDIVEFASLTQNAPAYFSKVTRKGSHTAHTYVAGTQTGVTYRLIDSNNHNYIAKA